MGTRTVLVVEDDADLRELMQVLLLDAGWVVDVARNGREGLEALERRLPDVVLLDMKMPVMNGWEFARELRARHGHRVPVVVVTAAENTTRTAAEIGAEGCIAKPFDVEDVLRAVERYAGVAAPGI